MVKRLLYSCPDCGGTKFIKVRECSYLDDSDPTDVGEMLLRLKCVKKECKRNITLNDLIEEIDGGKVVVVVP